MKSIRVTALSGMTEPFTYYNVEIYSSQRAKKPEIHFHGKGGDDVSIIIPLAIVMKYLHNHPVEKVAVSGRTEKFIKKELELLVQAHNAAIPQEYRVNIF